MVCFKPKRMAFRASSDERMASLRQRHRHGINVRGLRACAVNGEDDSEVTRSMVMRVTN